MNHNRWTKHTTTAIGALTIWLVQATWAQEAKPAGAALAPQARLAIVGDSITEQKLYSKFMEAYLLACAGRTDLRVMQFGWGGETAGGFAGRAENDLADFKPTVVTLCYGMNDGGYRAYEDGIGASYDKSMRAICAKLAAMGVKTIVVGSPGAVDTKYFKRAQGGDPAAVYNETLRRLRDLDEKLAAELKMPFADVHGAMIGAMTKAKAALGEDYDVCGRDGFHPSPNGHLAMAYAFLKALGVDGNIGEITVDLKGAATTSPGHRVLKSEGGTVELESTRYPFCFDGDAKASGGTRSLTPFLPFNQDLNRLTLKVKGLGAEKAKVTWGEASKEFTRAQLEAGVNLAAEFDKTPFDAAFQKVVAAVGAKQNYETNLIKGFINKFGWLSQECKDDADTLKAAADFRQKLNKHHDQLNAGVLAAIAPVKHTLTVAPVP